MQLRAMIKLAKSYHQKLPGESCQVDGSGQLSILSVSRDAEKGVNMWRLSGDANVELTLHMHGSETLFCYKFL